MALCITLFEYIAGMIFIVGMKIRLWDYSKNWGNIKGIICPQFTFYKFPSIKIKTYGEILRG